jgi:hypothetical protein
LRFEAVGVTLRYLSWIDANTQIQLPAALFAAHVYDMGSPTGLANAVAAFCGGSNSTGDKNFEMVAFDHFWLDLVNES